MENVVEKKLEGLVGAILHCPLDAPHAVEVLSNDEGLREEVLLFEGFHPGSIFAGEGVNDRSQAEVIVCLPLLESLLDGLVIVQGNITQAPPKQSLLALKEAGLSELIVGGQNEVGEVGDPHGHRSLQAALQHVVGLVSCEHCLLDVAASQPARRGHQEL